MLIKKTFGSKSTFGLTKELRLLFPTENEPLFKKEDFKNLRSYRLNFSTTGLPMFFWGKKYI